MKEDNIEVIEPRFKLLMIMYLTLFSVSLVLLGISEVRPYLYYVIVGAIAVIVLLEALIFETTNKKALLILAQIMLLSINLIWGVTLKYFYYVGRTDLMGHVWLAQNLLEFGHVTEVFDVYQAFPLWHILNSGLYMISGLDIPLQELLYVICGLVFLVLPAVVYLLGHQLFSDQKLAIVSSLIVAVSPVVLFYGMYSISRSIESFLFIVLLLVILKSQKSHFWLALFLTFGITAFHTVSIIFILVLLFVIYIIQRLLIKEQSQRLVSGRYLLASVAMVVIYWYLFARNLIDVLIRNIVIEAPEGMLTKSVSNAPLSELLNYVQYTPYLIFVILGVLLVLHTKKCTQTVKSMAILGLVLIPLTFPGPLLLLNKLAANFNIDRFDEFTFIFMGLVAAVGLIALYYRSSNVRKVAVVGLFAVLVLLSISNDFVASDNPIVKRPFYTAYLSEEEVASLTHLPLINAGYMLSDYVTVRFMEFSPYAAVTMPLKLDEVNKTIMRGEKNDLLIIRQDELNSRPLKLYQSESGVYTRDMNSARYTYYDKDTPYYDSLTNMNKVYDSRSVEGFV